MGVKEGGFGRKPVASPHLILPSFAGQWASLSLPSSLFGKSKNTAQGGGGRVYAICLQRRILLRNFGAAEMNLLQGKEAPRMGWGITEKIKGEHIQG